MDKTLSVEEKYMLRALELAKLGRGKVSPNPMVGCVIVNNNKIIAEGWHQVFGGPHAEINALNAIVHPQQLQEATVFVTLEPCAHYGKTPPCAHKLVEMGVKKVVIGATDPNPLVAGKGIQILEKAAIQVTKGILKEACVELNTRFFTFHQEKRPYVILKWAQTANGLLARPNFDSKWISNEVSRQLVHRWRSEEDAVLVGFHTAFYDNPRLNTRSWSGKNPLRLYIDYNDNLPNGHYLKDGTLPTICFTPMEFEDRNNLKYVTVDKENIIPDILNKLYERNIQSVIVEGGAKLLNKFLACGLWDEARVFKSSATFENGIKAPVLNTKEEERIIIKNDYLIRYNNT